jgi:hypothetical protein
MSQLDKLLDVVAQADAGVLREEIDNLRGIKAWAISTLELDYEVGDKVVICSWDAQMACKEGWKAYKDAFEPGKIIGTVESLKFSSYGKPGWYIDVSFDRLFRENGLYGTKEKYIWLGPESEKPEGMRQHYKPEGTTKVFMFPPHWVKKYVPEDEEPPEAKYLRGTGLPC